MLAEESPAGNGYEARLRRQVLQLKQGVFVCPVPVDDHHDGRRVIAFEVPQPSHRLFRQPAAVDRGADDRQRLMDLKDLLRICLGQSQFQSVKVVRSDAPGYPLKCFLVVCVGEK